MRPPSFLRLRQLALLAPALIGCRASSATAYTPPPAYEDAGPSPCLVAFPSGPRLLHGFLYRPPGAGPFPAVVFNHGSEPMPGDRRDEAVFYVPHGFVLFVPHRRGQGRSSDAGEYIERLDRARVVDELVAQTDDVMAAVEYVHSLPYVDGARVAVAGCSFGGILSLFAAERGTGIDAAVDFAGGAMSWSRAPDLQVRMKQAARAARVPVLFIQAENDFDVTPSRVLSEEMRSAGKPARMRIYPPNGSTHQEGHHLCYGSENPAWGDEVLSFLRASAR
ncbi:MAG: dienelactone hydrolase family protein [Myxococcales bacterium]|nr:dienelactone hydrolase family protein [Myxococcales bacterium]